jgi:hypothetical protein
MNEFVSLAIKNYLESIINWGNYTIILNSKQYNELAHVFWIIKNFEDSIYDQAYFEIFNPEIFWWNAIQKPIENTKEKMSEFIELVIKTIAETVTDLTEQQRSEIKYALEQAIELYGKDINGIKNKLFQNDKLLQC